MLTKLVTSEYLCLALHYECTCLERSGVICITVVYIHKSIYGVFISGVGEVCISSELKFIFPLAKSHSLVSYEN